MAWNPITISKKVGKGLDNKEEDVKKINNSAILSNSGDTLLN